MNFDYLNARLQGMKSHLLADNEYEILIHQPSVEAMANYLLRTSYHQRIESIYSSVYPIETLNKVFIFYFKDRMESIKNIVSEPYSNWISWILRKWDLLNIKIAIRMINNSIKNEQRKHYLSLCHQCLPLGDFNESDLANLFNVDDFQNLKDCLNSIKSPFANVFEQIDENEFYHNIMKIENELNKYYYSKMINILGTINTGSIFNFSKKNPLLKMVQEEINFENIKIALRWIRMYRLEPSSIAIFPFKEIFIPGGEKFNIQIVSGYLEEANFEKLSELINQFPFLEVSISDVYKEMEIHQLDYETRLESQFLRYQIKKKYGFSTKLNVLVSYYYSLITELRNLDIIMYGINGRIDPQILTRRVIYA